MQTQGQLRAALYNALIADTVIPNDIFWIGKPTVETPFPCLIYSIIDTTGAYAFSEGLTSKDFTVQIDVYTDVQDVTNMDIIIDRLDVIMAPLCYRNIGTPPEFLEESINKIIRPTRWELINV